MESNSCRKICRFCLETSDGNFETIEEVTLASLNVLWLRLNLSISEAPVMCEHCAKTIRTCSGFKSKCLEIQDCILSSVSDKNNVKADLGEVYVSKVSVENIVNVPDDNMVCRFCLKLVKNSSAIFLINRTDIVQKLEQYFPELSLTYIRDPVMCASCQASLQHYFSFINNCLITEEKIMEFCKVEGTNGNGQIALSSVLHFISKGFLKSKFEIGEVKIEEMCNEINKSNSVEIKKEDFLDMELDNKEDNSLFPQESNLTYENSSQYRSPSQSGCIQQVTKGTPAVYTCGICGYQNNRKGRLQNHILAHKRIVQKYNCEICSFKAKTEKYLKKHMLKHKDASEVHTSSHNVDTEVTVYKCELCDHKSKRKSNLKRHTLTHKTCSEITMFTCCLCDYEAKWRTSLKRHMVTHKTYSETIMYKCETCAFESRYKDSLQRHMRVHMDESEIDMYKCEVCPFDTKWSSSLRFHLLSHRNAPDVVMPDIMYKCDLCEHKAKGKSDLKRHVLTHKSPSEIPMYKCDHCDHETKRKFDLKTHMLTHKTCSEITMFRCYLCDYETKWKTSLKRHMLTHKTPLEITMYKCEQCAYETRYKYHLKQHMLIHMDVLEIEMHKCDVCHFETKWKNKLKQHLLSHRNIPYVYCISSILDL